MYVCICHALRERDVLEAAENGAETPLEVHHHFGVEPCCGRCHQTMEELLEHQKTACKKAA